MLCAAVASCVQSRSMTSPVIRRILAPVVLSEPQIPDMDYAVGVAGQLDAELVLFACIDTPAMVRLIGRHKAVGERAESFERSLVERCQGDLVEDRG